MDRRRVARIFFAAAGAALLCLALTTCSNPIDIVGSVATTVKIANNKFLKVTDAAPAKNDPSANPGAPIWIEFDRDLDTTSITPSAVIITPAATWTWSYNQSTRTLFVYPAALEGHTNYTVAVTGSLLATDGGNLQNSYSWSFKTADGPSGGIVIAGGAAYSTTATVNATVTYNSVVTQMRYTLDKATFAVDTGWGSPQSSISVPLGSDGPKTIYIQFKDASNNRTDAVNPISASIILDTVPPSLSAMTINSGAASTTSTSVTLNWTASDATSGITKMRFQNGSGLWSPWTAYSASKVWTLASTVGTRTVSMQLQDAATNISGAVSASIIYASPTLAGASLNTAALGTVTVTGLTTASADSGTDYIRVYRRDYPSGGTYTMVGSAVASSTSLNVSVPQGQLYYFHTTIYNSGGTETPYSAACPVGFTSNIAVIYNTNSTLANQIKSIIGTNWTGTYPVTGTMPTWSVTLIPQSFISTTYAAGNVIYGWPVIVTPDTTIYGNANMTRNVIAHGHGVIAMGTGGCRMLDTVSANYSSWGYVDTSPTQIGWGPSATGFPATIYANTWLTESVWTSPLSSTSVPTTNGTSTQMGYTGGELSRTGVYRNPQTNPTNGALYAQDSGSYPYYFPVARQGRFLQYGFEGTFDRPYTGWLFLVNLTYRMGATYF